MKIHWKVEGLDPPTSQPSDDLAPVSSSIELENGATSGQIVLSVLADDLPELSERFIVTLVSVDGGADIDTTKQSSSFTIRYEANLSGLQGQFWDFRIGPVGGHNYKFGAHTWHALILSIDPAIGLTSN